MEARIIVDSCCDLLPPMRKDVHVAPLKIAVNDVNEVVDDGTTDVPTLSADMAATDKPARSACARLRAAVRSRAAITRTPRPKQRAA